MHQFNTDIIVDAFLLLIDFELDQHFCQCAFGLVWEYDLGTK